MERLVCEFAVDPTAIDDWKTLRFLEGAFGWEQGRLIARFPKDWFQTIYERLATGRPNDSKVEICLQSLKGKMIRLGRPKKLGPGDWLTNARQEHACAPFRAIIARENITGEPFILEIDDLHGNLPLWKVPTDLPVPRDAGKMADVIAHLLLHATEVTFIDPYFHPKNNRFTYPLKAFCSAAKNPSQPSKTFHYHLAKGNEWELDAFEADCLAELPFIIPVGITVEFHIWSERIGGQDFHDRFVCFREGAIFWGHGLDDSPHTDGVVNVRLLSEDALRLRQSEFNKETSPFDLLHTVRIVGKRGA